MSGRIASSTTVERNFGHQLGGKYIKNPDVLILGQRSTGRLETLEEFLVGKTGILVVVGLAGLHHPTRGYVRVFRNSRLIRIYTLPNFYSQLPSPIIFPLYFGTNVIIATISILRFRCRFHLGIGVSAFYASILHLFKKLGLVKDVVYYCLDYYVPTGNAVSDFFIAISRQVDCYLASNSLVTWNLTRNIETQRRSHCRTSGKELLVPLTYDARLIRSTNDKDWDRWALVFVGTLDREKGLDMMAEALKIAITKLPRISVRIVGSGPHGEEFRQKLDSLGILDHFVFYGFIPDESKMMKLVSECAVGMGPYPTGTGNYAVNADPGKLKLYAFCGVPIVATRIPPAKLVDFYSVGLTSDDTPTSFAEAIIRLLLDESLLRQFRRNTVRLAKEFTSQKILETAFREIVNETGRSESI